MSEVDQLIEQVNAPTTPPVAPPANPAVAPPEEVDYKTKYFQLQTEADQWKSKATANPYPNDFVKSLADMYSGGKSPEEINQFVYLNTTDFSKMDPIDVLAFNMTMENPGLSLDKARILVLNDYPEPGEDDEKADALKQVRSIKLENAATQAIKGLSEKRASMTVQQQQVDPQEEARRASVIQSWGSVTDAVLALPRKIDFSHESDKIGGKYDFSFNVAVSPEEDKILKDALVNYAVQAGLELNKDGLAALQDQYQQMLWLLHKDEMMSAFVQDMYANLSDYFSKKYSGTIPNGGQRVPAPARQKPMAVNPDAPGTL